MLTVKDVRDAATAAATAQALAFAGADAMIARGLKPRVVIEPPPPPPPPPPQPSTAKVQWDDTTESAYNANTDNHQVGGDTLVGNIATFISLGQNTVKDMAEFNAWVEKLKDVNNRLVLGSPKFGAFSCLAVDLELGYQVYYAG